MVCIDQVDEVFEQGGSASVELKPDANYMSPDGLRPSSLVEFCAQAYGFVRAAWEHQQQMAPPKLNEAFLAAVNKIQWGAGTLPKSGTLNISVKTTRKMGPLSLCSAQVYQGDRQLLSMTLKVFAVDDRSSKGHA